MSHICGASLIASKWVLTAAHCLYQKSSKELTPHTDLRVVLGEHDSEKEDETFLKTRKIPLKKYFVHEGYRRLIAKQHDIALLKLEEEVDLSVYTPVCLPSSVRNRDNTPVLALGWGLTAPLLKSKNANCKVNYTMRSGDRHILQSVNLTVHHQVKKKKGFLMILHGEHNNGICIGDSGGPLLSRDGGQHTLIGVTSHTSTEHLNDDCNVVCWPGSRSFFTKVSLYTEWINQKMSSPTFCTGGEYAETRANSRADPDSLEFGII